MQGEKNIEKVKQARMQGENKADKDLLEHSRLDPNIL